jgi:hypothetical protein
MREREEETIPAVIFKAGAGRAGFQIADSQISD